MASHDHPTPLLAAAELRRAAGAILAELRSAPRDLLRSCGDSELAALTESLADPAATGESTASTVLSRCEAAIAAGTRMKTDWMPKASVGEDVVEWEAWTRPEISAEAAQLQPLASELRAYLDAHERLSELLDAEATLKAMRSGRTL